MATQEQVENLKAQWKADPCWDIEDTEGFEKHREELKAFHDQVRAEWDAKEAKRVSEKCAKYGITEKMLEYIEYLEFKIKRLEDKLNANGGHYGF